MRDQSEGDQRDGVGQPFGPLRDHAAQRHLPARISHLLPSEQSSDAATGGTGRDRSGECMTRPIEMNETGSRSDLASSSSGARIRDGDTDIVNKTKAQRRPHHQRPIQRDSCSDHGPSRPTPHSSQQRTIRPADASNAGNGGFESRGATGEDGQHAQVTNVRAVVLRQYALPVRELCSATEGEWLSYLVVPTCRSERLSIAESAARGEPRHGRSCWTPCSTVAASARPSG